VLLLSSGNLGYAAVEAFNRVGTEPSTKAVPAVLLLGEAHAAWAEQAEAGKHNLVLQMPVKSRELRHAILKVLQLSAAGQATG
jgi:CheY-like chemotaxis protein